MGLLTKNEKESAPKYLPGTKKDETARYECICQSVSSESAEVGGKVCLKYRFVFFPVRTFPDGEDVESKYGLTPAEVPLVTLEMNTEEAEGKIETLLAALGWNGKEGEKSVCKHHMVCDLNVNPPRPREGGKGYWPGKTTLEDIDAMPTEKELFAHRMRVEAMREKTLAAMQEKMKQASASPQQEIAGTEDSDKSQSSKEKDKKAK